MLDVNIRSKVFNAADGSVLKAIENLAFSTEKNSFTSIVGPSGCGKTTTLRIVLGLETNFDGDIKFHDDGAVAAVFQEPRLLPWRTVEQNVRLALPKALRSKNLDALFEALGLSEMRNFFPNELSLGLARRVSLARGFATEPALLILDEPFVSLDDQTANRLRKLLMELWQSHPVTALMVTHNVREAVELSDRILFLSSRPASIITDYSVELPRAERNEQAVDEIVRYLKKTIDL